MAVFLSLFAGAGAQFFNNSGVILSGGLIYSYSAGTTTPLATYTTSSGNTAHTNPIVLDSAGRVPSGGEIWTTVTSSYKFVLKDSNGVTIATYDNLSSPVYANNILYNEGGANAVDRTLTTKLQEWLSVKDFGAVGDGVTDDTNAFTYALTAATANQSVLVPAGSYKITGTLNGDFVTFGTVSIIGGYVNYVNNLAASNAAVTMYRTVNSNNSTPGKWVVLTPEGALDTTGTTTQGLQEAIDYITEFGYDLYVYGSPVAPPNFPPPYTSFNGQEPAIIFLDSAITFYPLQKGVIKILDVTLNFNSGVTGAAITFDSIIIADIDFSGSQIVCAAATVGVSFNPTNYLPNDQAAGVVISDCRIKLCAVVVPAGSTCVLINCTNGPFIGVDLNISELNGGAYGVLVNPATNGFIANKIFVLDAHLQTSAAMLIGTNATNGVLAYGNSIELFAQPAVGGVGLDIWGINNIIKTTVLSSQGVVATAIKFESSAAQNIVLAGQLQATTLAQDASTAKSNVIQYGSDCCSVHLNGVNQSIPNNAVTKVGFNVELFDQMNTYNTTTYRWTPLIPGNGQISANILFSDALPVGSPIKIAVYKNGAVYKQTADVSGANVAGNSIGISCAVQIESATDYFEIFAFQNSGGARNIDGTAIDSWATYKRY
jgi:hypothetical protein